MIVLVDSYDSFVHNLARYFVLLGTPVRVIRHDAKELGEMDLGAATAVVFSPGPSTPDNAGQSLQLIHRWHQCVPMLGVCLGHQSIVQSFGGKIIRTDQPLHGQASPVIHDRSGEFAGLPNPFIAARYHSLVVDPQSVPDCLDVTARTQDGIIMAVRHRTLPLFGWQFHPESILTESGMHLLAAFLQRIGVSSRRVGDLAKQQTHPSPDEQATWPVRPITF